MKLITWLIGMNFLFVGAYDHVAPDWDYGVSLAMGVCTYLTAANTMNIIIERQWRRFHIAIMDTWVAVDGVYTVYWYFMDRSVLLDAREAQWPLSLVLYLACGLIWTVLDPVQRPCTPESSDSKKEE